MKLLSLTAVLLAAGLAVAAPALPSKGETIEGELAQRFDQRCMYVGPAAMETHEREIIWFVFAARKVEDTAKAIDTGRRVRVTGRMLGAGPHQYLIVERIEEAD